MSMLYVDHFSALYISTREEALATLYHQEVVEEEVKPEFKRSKNARFGLQVTTWHDDDKQIVNFHPAVNNSIQVFSGLRT